MNLHSMVLKIACLTLLIMGSGLRAMDAKRELDLQLISAADSGNEQKVEELLDRGAHINAQDKMGNTALSIAVYYGHKAIWKLLIKAMVDRALDPKAEIAKIENIEARIELLSYLNSIQEDKRPGLFMIGSRPEGMDTKKVDLRTSHATTSNKQAQANKEEVDVNVQLVSYSANGNKQAVADLIARGVNVNKRDKYGRVALREAAEYGRKEVCELLITAGANVNEVKNSYGETALYIAAWKGYKDICGLLIANGANVNARDQNGNTALSAAEFGGYKEICQLLIDHGADVNAKTTNGYTVLMGAALVGHKQICKLLIENGADVYAENSDGHTALKNAVEHNRKEISELLIRGMLRPTNEERLVVKAYIASLKKIQPDMPKDVRRLLVETTLKDFRQPKKPKARAEIMKIKNGKEKQELLEYLNNL